MTKFRSIAAFAAVVLVAAACGNDDDQSSAPTQEETAQAADQCDEQNLVEDPLLPELYDPCPFAAGDPGELVGQEEVSEAPAGTRAWRISHHSTTVAGTDEVVSALVVAPDGEPPTGGFPVLAFAHPTTGAARQCAPSLRPDRDIGDPTITGVTFFELVAPFVDDGFAVVATDYRGLGTPGPHPYLVGQAEGNNVLDAARAIRQLSELTLNDQTLIFGHSQGGQAAAFAAEQAAEYAPELDVLGAAQLAPAAELKDLLDAELRDPALDDLGLAVIAMRAWQQVYPEAARALDALLTDSGSRAIEVGTEECLTAVYDAFEGKTVDELFTGDPLQSDVLVDLLDGNSAGNAGTSIPMFVGQGTADDIVLPKTIDTYVQRICSLGNTVEFERYQGATHGTVVLDALDDVKKWLDARLSGDTAPSNC